MEEVARHYIADLEIKVSSASAPVGSLSGGTQQKVAIGSAFAAHPQLLLLEDPTRGVDIKTRNEIITQLRAFVAAGNAIVAFSPELDEVFELADVVRVAVKGTLSPPLHLDETQSLEDLAYWVDATNQQGATVPLDGQSLQMRMDPRNS